MTTEVQRMSNAPTIDIPTVTLDFGANKPLKMTTIKEAEFQKNTEWFLEMQRAMPSPLLKTSIPADPPEFLMCKPQLMPPGWAGGSSPYQSLLKRHRSLLHLFILSCSEALAGSKVTAHR